jgi:hypothetical protein
MPGRYRFSPRSSPEKSLKAKQTPPHARYQGIADTIVQLLYFPYLWPNRNRSKWPLIGLGKIDL